MDEDYQLDRTQDPPIPDGLFRPYFYGCNQVCRKATLDVFQLFHECTGRNSCGKFRILERLPKRRKKWEIDRDEESDEAWGLHVSFCVAFYKVALYHLLILAAPLTSWGLWLRKWPSDWQNASVPFFAVMVLLSLFWLPFAHKVGSEEMKQKTA